MYMSVCAFKTTRSQKIFAAASIDSSAFARRITYTGFQNTAAAVRPPNCESTKHKAPVMYAENILELKTLHEKDSILLCIT